MFLYRLSANRLHDWIHVYPQIIVQSFNRVYLITVKNFFLIVCSPFITTYIEYYSYLSTLFIFSLFSTFSCVTYPIVKKKIYSSGVCRSTLEIDVT